MRKLYNFLSLTELEAFLKSKSSLCSVLFCCIPIFIHVCQMQNMQPVFDLLWHVLYLEAVSLNMNFGTKLNRNRNISKCGIKFEYLIKVIFQAN
jgi:predicted ABC-type exoprotein transport system permease subunit